MMTSLLICCTGLIHILRLLGRTRFVVKMFSRVPPDVVRFGSPQLGELRFCMVYSGQTFFDFVRFAMKFDHCCWPNLVCFVGSVAVLFGLRCGAHLGMRRMVWKGMNIDWRFHSRWPALDWFALKSGAWPKSTFEIMEPSTLAAAAYKSTTFVHSEKNASVGTYKWSPQESWLVVVVGGALI